MTDVVLAGYARSPFCFADKGELARTRPDDLAALVVRGLLDRVKVNVADIEDLILGCAFPEGEQGLNIGRLVALNAQMPLSVAGVTVNRFCGSSMQAVHMAAGALRMGAGEAFICAGVESMTRVPLPGFNPMINPALLDKCPGAYMSMGQTAENVARKYNVSRREQEVFAVLSHAKAAAAQNAGFLAAEIVSVPLPSGMVDKDGCIRPNTTVEKLAELPTVVEENGTVTAGTAPPHSDGAAAVLVTRSDYALAQGLVPMAKIRSVAVAGCAPDLMGMGAVVAAQKALQRAGLTLKDIDVIELNEGFASQAIACIRAMDMDIAKVNMDGGAIALGHPLGATGARLAGKAASLLKRQGKTFALVTQCVGGGQGIATVLEAV